MPELRIRVRGFSPIFFLILFPGACALKYFTAVTVAVECFQASLECKCANTRISTEKKNLRAVILLTIFVPRVKAGNNNLRGRFSTVDLPIKVACFVKK